jgi:hypothetical protein
MSEVPTTQPRGELCSCSFLITLVTLCASKKQKIEFMTRNLVVEMLGERFGDNFITLPADGTRGVVLIACTNDFQITVEPLTAGCQYSISGTVLNRVDNTTWSITGVYGPQEDDLKRSSCRKSGESKGWLRTSG